jgi:phenylpropionate dioxygenase-like ring-hydroxylating dioxygenase large terminal subunit
LSYGRIEDGGLRCIYHGWLYDVHGRVLDQPGEAAGGEHKESIRHPAYPCEERGGVIFAYLGAGEPPLLPNYEFLTAAEDHRSVIKYYHDCSHLQSNEGNIDPVHLSFLHRSFRDPGRRRPVRGSDNVPNTLYGRDVAPSIDVEITDFGLRISTVRRTGPEESYLRVSNFVYPNLSAFPGPTGGDGYAVNWHVPIDDTHHWKYVWVFGRAQPLPERYREADRAEVLPGYRLRRNRENRYLQDRASMNTEAFAGMGLHFPSHDAFATESQGPIQDRTREHLVSSDKPILAARKLLLKAIEDVRAGREAPHVVRHREQNRFPNLVVISDVIPHGTDWKDYTRQVERELSL